MSKLKQVLKDNSIEEILNRLRIDEDYYGEFGQNFLSNSDVGKLINNPEDFHKPSEPNVNFLVGGAFHQMVLEPHKFDRTAVVESSSRQTKKYKEAVAESGEDMLLLTKEMDNLDAMFDRIEGCDLIRDIIRGDEVEYEVPAISEICGEMWKGKADVVNHNEGLIVDLKTTSDISKFHVSAKRYNYDSQAFIYKMLFGYDMVFVAIDKKTHKLGFFDCSEQFYQSGKEKVVEAVYAYRMYYKDNADQEFDWANYLITETL